MIAVAVCVAHVSIDDGVGLVQLDSSDRTDKCTRKCLRSHQSLVLTIQGRSKRTLPSKRCPNLDELSRQADELGPS